MKLYETLVNQIIKKKKFVSSNGKINKWMVIDSARNYDPDLIETLLANQKLRKEFFISISSALIFKQNEFMTFLEMKSYLNSSFTRYKNKVGLMVNNQYIQQQNEVVLVWPYKDGVLEGGQTKEEDTREEIFFNELLALDEITQLFEPKVLTGSKKYHKGGTNHFPSFSRDTQINDQRGLPKQTITDNLIIKGNNLLAMHSLKKEFAGKIKLIYIDPPYNTGNDGFRYNDRFNRSTWLTFMKNRLEVAKTLLHPNGSIFVQCDDHEQATLKLLMDELFGRENHIETIVVKTSTPSGVNAVNVKRGERLFKVKEYLIFYSKSPSYRFYPMYIKSTFNPNYRYELIKTKSGYRVIDLKQKFRTNAELEKYALSNPDNIFSLEKNNKKAGRKVKQVIRNSKRKNTVIEFLNSNGHKVLIYNGGVFIPLKNRVVNEAGTYYFGTLISDLWDDEVFQTNQTEGGVNLPGGKKPEKLIKRIIELTTREHDIVLDYHLGSGTTAAVAHKMNRQYIGIEQLDYGKDDSIVRLQNVIQGDPTGISKSINWKGGGSFIYFELKKYNQYFIDKINQANSFQKLWLVWLKMKEKSFLKYQVDIPKLEQHTNHFKSMNINEQKQHLINLLDKNQLYINLSSIDDSDFHCTTEEKIFTRAFYLHHF